MGIRIRTNFQQWREPFLPGFSKNKPTLLLFVLKGIYLVLLCYQALFTAFEALTSGGNALNISCNFCRRAMIRLFLG